jgi:hypothetical protein
MKPGTAPAVLFFAFYRRTGRFKAKKRFIAVKREPIENGGKSG